MNKCFGSGIIVDIFLLLLCISVLKVAGVRMVSDLAVPRKHVVPSAQSAVLARFTPGLWPRFLTQEMLKRVLYFEVCVQWESGIMGSHFNGAIIG